MKPRGRMSECRPAPAGIGNSVLPSARAGGKRLADPRRKIADVDRRGVLQKRAISRAFFLYSSRSPTPTPANRIYSDGPDESGPPRLPSISKEIRMQV